MSLTRTLVRGAVLSLCIVAVFTATARAQICFSDNFDAYSNGPLVGQGGWTGNAGSEISVCDGPSSKGVCITAGSGTTTANHAVNCPACENGIITVSFKIKGDAAGNGSTMWSIWFDDTNGVNLARFYKTCLNLAGRTDGLGAPYITDTTNINLLTLTDFDECKAVIDTVNHTTAYYMNNTLLKVDAGGTNPMSNGVDAAAGQTVVNSIGAIRLERTNNGGATGTIIIDDIQIVSCDGTCSAQITPTAAQTAYAVAGGEAASPATIAYTVLNANQDPLSYTVQEVDSSGAAHDWPWLSLDKTSGGPLSNGQSDVVTASLNTTGLTTGLYVAYLKFTDACSPARTYTRAIKLYIDNVLAEDFNYPDKPLQLAPGWTGPQISSQYPNPNPVTLVGGALKVIGQGGHPTFGPAGVLSVRQAVPPTAPVCETNGRFSVKLKIQGGAGVSNIVSVYADGPNNYSFFRLRCTGTSIAVNIGGVDLVIIPLTPGVWGQLELIFDTKAKTGHCLFDAAEKGTHTYLDPLGGSDPGNAVTTVRVEQLNNGDATDFLYFDDLSISRCVRPCNDPVYDVRDASNAEVADGYVDAHDFLGFLACVTGPAPTDEVFNALSFDCKCMDLNGDRAIDINDFGAFQLCYSGATEKADPNCDN